MRYNTTIVSNELAIPERWPLDRAFDIYAQIYAHFFEKTPFTLYFYSTLTICKPLYIKGFRSSSFNGNKSMSGKYSPLSTTKKPLFTGVFSF